MFAVPATAVACRRRPHRRHRRNAPRRERRRRSRRRPCRGHGRHSARRRRSISRADRSANHADWFRAPARGLRSRGPPGQRTICAPIRPAAPVTSALTRVGRRCVRSRWTACCRPPTNRAISAIQRSISGVVSSASAGCAPDARGRSRPRRSRDVRSAGAGGGWRVMRCSSGVAISPIRPSSGMSCSPETPCGFVHRSADANVATFHQRLEIRQRAVEERAIGVCHQRGLQVRDQVQIEHLPEERQREELASHDGDACPVAVALERGDPVVVGGRARSRCRWSSSTAGDDRVRIRRPPAC